MASCFAPNSVSPGSPSRPHRLIFEHHRGTESVEAGGQDTSCSQGPRADSPLPLPFLRLSKQDVSSRAPPAGCHRDRPLRAEEPGCPRCCRAPPRQGPSRDWSRALPDFRPLSSRGLVSGVGGALLPQLSFFPPLAEGGANISSFNVAQLSRLYDLKCFSLIHFNLVNMLQQVANFSGMALPRHLHIKSVGGRPISGCTSRGQLGLLQPVVRLALSGGRGRGPGRGLRWGSGGRAAGGRGTWAPGRGPASPSPPPRNRPELPPTLIPGRGAPWVPHGLERPGHIYPKCVY